MIVSKLKCSLHTIVTIVTYFTRAIEAQYHKHVCHTMYLGKKCFFHIISQKKCALGKTPLLPLGHAQSAFIDQRFPNMIQRLFADVIHDAI